MESTPESFLRIRQVCARCGMSRSSVYAAIKSGTFPRPVKIGARSSAWRSSEVEAWIAHRIAASKAAA